MKRVLLKDIVIPKGTVFESAPIKKEMYGDHAECFIGLTKDTCGSFIYPMEDDKEKLSEYFAELKE